MRIQQAIYIGLSILLTGLFSYDVISKIICTLTHGVHLAPVQDKYMEIIAKDLAFIIVATIVLEVYTIALFVKEWISKMNRFGSGPFRFAVYALGLHLANILIIKSDNHLFRPLLGLEILGKGFSWPYHLAFNLLILASAYKGAGLRKDLVWQRSADLMCGPEFIKPLSKFKLFK